MTIKTEDEFTLNRSSLSDQVASVIREQILTGRLKPGESVLQLDWAKRLGVSRMPVRDAIRRLCTEGVLVSTGSNSAKVASINPEEVYFAYEMSALALSFAARRAAAVATREEIAELEEIHERFRDAVNAGENGEAQKLNWLFHRAVTRAYKSHQIRALLRVLSISVPLSVYEMIPEWPRHALADHQRVLAAIKAKDSEGASKAMYEHVNAVSEPTVTGIVERLSSQEA